LIEEPKPYLECGVKGISDPWGSRYQYDSAGKHTGGNVPDVWTTVPGSNEVLGNWKN
jgi:hypothetical protein